MLFIFSSTIIASQKNTGKLSHELYSCIDIIRHQILRASLKPSPSKTYHDNSLKKSIKH